MRISDWSSDVCSSDLHGLAALSEAAARSFDLALLDLDLPGLDGFALARQLRTSGFTAPLLAVPARADPDAEPQPTAAGLDGFLPKPLTRAIPAEALEALRHDQHPRPSTHAGPQATPQPNQHPPPATPQHTRQ